MAIGVVVGGRGVPTAVVGVGVISDARARGGRIYQIAGVTQETGEIIHHIIGLLPVLRHVLLSSRVLADQTRALLGVGPLNIIAIAIFL